MLSSVDVPRILIVASAAYHDVMPKEMVDSLKHSVDPTSIYVRTRSDRIARHKTYDLSILIEFKTNDGPHRNMAIEAVPLAHHILSSAYHVICLYIYRDCKTGLEGCFFAGDDLKIDRIIIPSKWADLSFVIDQAFPGVPQHQISSVSGSGDPFAIVSESNLSSVLSDWKKEIDELIDDAKKYAEKRRVG